jgi:exodeoxyribonuclease X
MSYLTIDLETTGLPSDPAVEVIEWALVEARLSPAGLTSLVKPTLPIPPETSAIHHIIDADVADAPTWSETTERLRAIVLPADVLVAHNADFEKHFIGPILPDNSWICTYKCAMRAWPEAPVHSNEALRYWLKLGTDRGRSADQHPHSALHDARVTARLLAVLMDKYDADTLLQWSDEPARLPRCPLHKHRGESWSEIPTDYLEWIVYKTTDMRREVWHSAKAELDRRANEDESKPVIWAQNHTPDDPDSPPPAIKDDDLPF